MTESDGSSAVSARRHPHQRSRGHIAEVRRVLWTALALAVLGIAAFAALYAGAPGRRLPLLLKIEGTAGREAYAVLSWDDDRGHTALDQKRIALFGEDADVATRHDVEISTDGSRNPLAKGAEAWITGIRLHRNGRWTTLDLSSAAKISGDVVDRPGAKVLLGDGGSLAVSGVFDRIEIGVVHQPWSGMLTVTIDGRARVEDLYSDRNAQVPIDITTDVATGPYAKTVSLPARPLQRLTLSSEAGAPLGLSAVSLLEILPASDHSEPAGSAAPATRQLWTETVDPAQTTIVITEPVLTRLVTSGRLLLYQASGAALLVIVLFGFYRAAGMMLARNPADRAGYWVFWLLFCCGLAHSALWVLGEWPGFPTNDTLNQLQERAVMAFEDDPFVHTLFLDIVADLFGSLGAVTLLQALLSAGLGALTFHALWRRRCPTWLVLVFGLLFAASPVIAIYDLQPWHDIPFSLCVSYWVMWSFTRAFDRLHGGGVARLDGLDTVALGVLLFFTATVRYNGLVLLGVIPVLLLAARLISWRGVGIVAGTALILYAVFLGPVATLLGVRADTDYNKIAYSVVINPIQAILATKGGYRSNDPEGDKAIVAAVVDPDALARAYNPLSVTPVIGLERKLPSGDPAYANLVALYRRLVVDNPSLFLAERTRLFFASIGFDTWGYVSALGQTDGPRNVAPPKDDNLSHLVYSPVSDKLGAHLNALLPTFRAGPGWTDRYVLYFTAVPGLVLLIACLLTSFWLPATALASLIVAVEVAGLFVTEVSSSFRIFYFLYLFELFVIPMALTEWFGRRRERRPDERSATAS